MNCLQAQLGLLLVLSGTARAAEVVDYVGKVLPIMKDHCWDCHSNETEVKGNLALDPETLFDQIGTYNIIRPGNPDESGFVERMKLDETHNDFMPRKGTSLPKKDIEAIEEWIRAGAIVDAKKPTEEESKRIAEMGAASPSGGEKKAEEFLSWTNREGRTIEAKMIGIEGDSVKLVMKNGRSYLVPISSLDGESAAQAKRISEK